MKKSFNTSTAAPVITKRFHEDNFAGIKQQLQILPELRELIPPLTSEELEQLESNILKEGCRESLLVWQTTKNAIGQEGFDPVYILIDGHNRYSICQRNTIPFQITLKEFSDLEAVKDFMIDNQLGRRNLKPEQMSYLRGRKYLSLKKGHGGDRRSEGTHLPSTDDSINAKPEKQKTAEILAKQFGVTERTIRNDAAFAEGIDKLQPELRQNILNQKVKVPKRDILALNELGAEATSITGIEELEQRIQLQEKNSTSVPRKRAKAETNSNSTNTAVATDRSSEFSTLVQEINQLASLLDPASPSLLAACEKLIRQTQLVIERLKS